MVQAHSLPLTIYKIKKGGVADSVFDSASFSIQSFSLSGASNCLLATRQGDSAVPSWFDYIQEFSGGAVEALHNTQAGALIYLEVAGEPLVISFGSAHTKLREEVIERGFGLRVALNCVEPQHISTVDSQNLDLNGIQQRMQATATTALEEFDLDVEGALVRAVTGAPSDSAIGAKITGRDGLRLLTKCMPADIPALIKRLIEFSKATDYKKAFEWIDNLEEIRDPSEIAALDAELLEQLATPNPFNTWLALPEIIDWVEIDGFVYGPGSKEIELDISLERFLKRVGSKQVTLELLRESKVKVLGSAGKAIRKWSVYKCLYAEAQLGSDRCVLSGGQWYRIKHDYYEGLKNFIDSIKCTADVLPDCDAGMKEDEYNLHVAKNSSGYLLGDKKPWRCGSKAGRLELCDLYALDKRLIHVKKYGQSKVLGHLFNQAVVSAEVLAMDKVARARANKLLGGAEIHFPDDFNPDEYTVVMAIVSEQPGNKLSLPLFSQIAFRGSVQRIEALGYKSELTKVRQPHFAKAK